MKLYRESHLGKRLPAYDGRKSLYTAGPLPFLSKEFKITLIDEDDGSGGQRYSELFSFLCPTLTIECLISFQLCAQYSILSFHQTHKCSFINLTASKGFIFRLSIYLFNEFSFDAGERGNLRL